MKKTLVSALTAALVVGAAGTVFAAANPFSDVPADHWAYDAVAQLAQDGIIEGYGDATYRGQQEITRYEMAQMIARAMAKNNGVDQAILDKLAAEFADELNALGVRVAALEKKVDNVKWTGRIRWRTYHRDIDGAKSDQNILMFRLEPKATVNKHWFVQTRFDYNITDAQNSPNGTLGAINRMWAQGQYGNTTIKLGKLPFTTVADYGMTHAWTFTGAAVTFGKNIKADVYGGRISTSDTGSTWTKAQVMDLAGIEIYNNRKNKFTYGIGYMNIDGMDKAMDAAYGDTKASIIHAGLGYKFSKKLSLTGAYAKNTKGDADSKERTRMHFELKYGAANKAKPGTWEAWVSYMKYGQFSGLRSAEHVNNSAFIQDFKGYEVGAKVTLDKNIDAQIRYFDGERVSNSKNDIDAVFTEVNFFF